MRGSNFQRTYYIYVHTNKLPIHASIYALDHSQVLYIYYKLLQCRCLHFIETRIQILHYSSRKQVHSIIQTNLNANCSSTCLLCFYIDVCICSRQLLNIYWIILLSYVSNSMPTYFTLWCLVYASTNKRICLFIGFHSIGVAIFFSDTISCVRELKHIASIL